MKKLFAPILAALAMLLGFTGSAMADATAATTAITSAQTDALAVVGGLTAMGIAIWSAYFIYVKFFKGK